MRKKTNEEFIEEVKSLVSNEYTFLDSYQGSKIKIPVRHNKCGKEYFVTPNNFLTGYRCPYCNGGHVKSTSNFYSEVERLVGSEYTFIGEYHGNKSNMKVIHNTCGHSYYVSPLHFIRGSRCPYCSHRHNKSTLEYKEELVAKGINIIPLENYKGTGQKIKHECLVCGNTWYVCPNHVLSGSQCPNCSLHSKQSTGERLVEQYLIDHNIIYEYPKTFPDLRDKKKLHYDFYLPEINCLIEYQGIQHYYPTRGSRQYAIQVKHDQIKKEYALANNYMLVEIPYTISSRDALEKFMYNLRKAEGPQPK